MVGVGGGVGVEFVVGVVALVAVPWWETADEGAPGCPRKASSAAPPPISTMPAPPAMTTARRVMPPSLRCSGGAEGAEGVGTTGAEGATTGCKVNELGEGGVFAQRSAVEATVGRELIAAVGSIVDASGDTDGAEGSAAGGSEGAEIGACVGAEETAGPLPADSPAGGVFVCETSSYRVGASCLSALSDFDAGVRVGPSSRSTPTGADGGGWSPGTGAIVGCDEMKTAAPVSRLAWRKALAKARTLLKRFFGSFSSAVITTCSTAGEIAGIFPRRGGAGVKRCWLATSVNDP